MKVYEKKKRIERVFFSAVLCLCVLAAYVPATVMAKTEGSQPVSSGAISLMEEDFFYLGSDKVISGWIVDSTGGSYNNTTTSGLAIKDDSAEAAVQLRKEFLRQTNNLITVETSFKKSGTFSVSFMVMDGDVPVIKVGTMGKHFGYCAEDGSFVNLWEFTGDGRIKMEIDLKMQKYAIYQDGILVKVDLPFFSNTHSADGVLFRTSTEEIGGVRLESVRVYTGYQVYDSFMSAGEDVLPTGWTVEDGGSAATVMQTAHGAREAMVLRVHSGGAAGTVATRAFEKTTAKTVAEILLMTDTAGENTAVRLMNGTTEVVKLFVNNGVWSYMDGSTAQKMTYKGHNGNIAIDARAASWYNFRVLLDPATGKADIYANYKLVASGIRVPKGGLDALRFVTAQDENAGIWLEDVRVYAYSELPEDYVEVPVVPKKTTSARVGMQTFNAWDNGKHIGWDPVTCTPSVDMPLGYYNESSTEACDWQIKYMVEHGVDFMFVDWYEYFDFNGADPMVEPAYGFFYDGYFYSEYSEYLNFAIQVFAPYYNMENYVDHIVPYWFRYYFNDPRYEVIDNKPVIGFGELDNLAETLGGLDKVTELLDYINAECIKAGFDGAYFLTINNTTSSRIVDAGFDGTYWYAMGNVPWTEMKNANQSAYNKFKATTCALIPTLSVGWSDESWHMSEGTAPDRRMDVKDFDAFCQWMKGFLQEVPEDSITSKIVVLDNWNEYAEGHSIMPTYKRGFGYLDAIGKAFTATADFTKLNTVPTEKQRDRLNTYFPKSWDRRVWEFDYGTSVTEFWSGGSGITGLCSDAKGHMQGVVSYDYGAGEYIQCLEGQHIDASKKKLVISMMNTTDVTGMKVYFTTEASTEFSEDKSFSLALKSEDEYYSTYVVDVGANSKWKGTITQLRLHFMMEEGQIGGNFYIDYIRLLENSDLKATPALGAPIESLVIPFEYELLEAADYYAKPLVQSMNAAMNSGLTITLTGAVTGRDVSGYTIRLDGGAELTLSTGTFQFKNVALGQHTFYIYDTEGFLIAKRRFTIKEGNTAGYSDGVLTVTAAGKKGEMALTISNLPEDSFLDETPAGDGGIGDVVPDDQQQPDQSVVPDDGSTTDPGDTTTTTTTPSKTKPTNKANNASGGILLYVGIGAGVAVLTAAVILLLLIMKKRKAAKTE